MATTRGGKKTGKAAGNSGSRKPRRPRVRRPKTAATRLELPPPPDLIPGQIPAKSTLARGPRKKRPGKTPPTRLSNHKARSQWFQARAAWPIREASVSKVVQERTRVAKSLPALDGTAQWELVGPTNIGGRLTSLVCDPRNPDRIWVGAAGS